ncbi:MAG: PQQ-binding-like beta-propeller repeat protein [Euryarchaeota archaeon]|nr:PQQ-binding-like beta-propeller repeat protein [Euryarchaeota archaeon]
MEHIRQVLIRIILAVFLISIFVQVSSATDLEPPLKVAWKYRLGAADVYGHNIIQSIELITDDVVYAKYGGRLVALDTDNGKRLWDKDLNGGLAYKNDVLYVARSRSTSLYALDAMTGKEIWRKEYSELDARSRYDLVIFKDALCIITKERSRNLHILAVDTNGNVKWHHEYPGSPDVFKRPTVSSNLMVISLSKNKLIAIDIITGETIWQIKDIEFNGNIHSYKDLFFIENLRENDSIHIMAVSKDTGKTVWKRMIGHSKGDILAIKDNRLVVIEEDIKVLNSENGDILAEYSSTLNPRSVHRYETIFKHIAIPNRIIYATTYSGIYAIDLNTGELLWNEDGKGGISPYFYEDKLYLIRKGKLYAYEHGVEVLIYIYFALFVLISGITNIFIKRKNINNMFQKSFQFSTLLILVAYLWFLLFGIPFLISGLDLIPSIDTYWIFYLLFPSVSVITGALIGTQIKNKFLIGMVAGAAPYMISLVVSVVLYRSDIHWFILLIWIPIYLCIIFLIGLVFGVIGSLLNLVLYKIES